MKKILVYTFVIIVILTSISIYYFVSQKVETHTSKNKITLLITPYNEEYLTGELVWINVKILNNSNQPYKMIGEFILDGSLIITVKDDEGISLSSGLTSDSYADYKPDTVLLLPGQIAENDINLSWYNLSNISALEIIANYNDLESNRLEIPIKNPEGFEKKCLNF